MHTNRLSLEKSPYLLQHAHNPVDWYPWSEEAFAAARAQEKPVFLSIGYSTCHWCHVMERESFENEEIAEVLNQNFISVKVDREERPDVDGIYMHVCQMLTGGGGWPLTVFLTPEQKPFYVGTYFPPESQGGQLGLLELLGRIARMWSQERERLLERAEEILDVQIQPEPAQGAYRLTALFDSRYGGLYGAPKFPLPHNLLYLLAIGQEQPQAAEQAYFTLDCMYRGGIFDHLGGGFSRYSTDEQWLVPHFEKMLYDNALLVLAYLEGYERSKKPLYLTIAERTISYLQEELMHDKGAFFCGQDADSDGEEGKYYVFTPQEIAAVLGEEGASLFCAWYHVTDQGNFEGKSVLNLLDNPRWQAPFPRQEDICKLLAYRRGRAGLHLDDKILAAWNGLAVWALARAFQVTGRSEYYKQAKKAAAFVRANMMTLNGRMRVRWREGDVAFEGNLDDYAFFGLGLFALYQCDYDVSWLRTCMQLAEEMRRQFWDEVEGGFFFTPACGEAFITRRKEWYDGALPAGNSAAALLLVWLAHLIQEEKWQQMAREQLEALDQAVGDNEAGHALGFLARRQWQDPGIHVVCTSQEEIPEEDLRCYRRAQGRPLYALVLTDKNRKSLARLIPSLEAYEIAGEIQYYVCKDHVCQEPVTELNFD
ncbi:MAG: thioredoxin domain-containing protein [Lachnospiraceae bacterium]|nr:thioredoxin domain-containing protein [Lachnospiraceae bacterium]